MFINLHNKHSGQEIIEAFKSASTFQEASDKRWKPDEFIREFQYQSGSAKQTVRSKGVATSPFLFRKKWWLWGEKVWKDARNPVFTLEPLELAKDYQGVEISVRYVYDLNEHFEFVATGPHDSEFEDVRPQFEKILDKFFALLEK